MAVISLLVIVFNFSCNYFHKAKDKLEKCKAPYSIEASPSNKNEFNHNVIIRYKCKGNQEYKQSICINGRWDPEPTCTSKFLFALSSSGQSSLSLPVIIVVLSS